MRRGLFLYLATPIFFRFSVPPILMKGGELGAGRSLVAEAPPVVAGRQQALAVQVGLVGPCCQITQTPARPPPLAPRRERVLDENQTCTTNNTSAAGQIRIHTTSIYLTHTIEGDC